jgi:hypothetical protein
METGFDSQPGVTHNTHTEIIMSKTPYELRFEIFKQAYNMLNDEFCVDYDFARTWNENSMNQVKMDLPEFPSLRKVLKQAEVINAFVSSNQ